MHKLYYCNTVSLGATAPPEAAAREDLTVESDNHPSSLPTDTRGAVIPSPGQYSPPLSERISKRWANLSLVLGLTVQ